MTCVKRCAVEVNGSRWNAGREASCASRPSSSPHQPIGVATRRRTAMVRADSSRAASLAWVVRGLCGLLGLAGLAGLALSGSSRVSTPFAAGEAAASLIVIASAVVLFRSAGGSDRPGAGLLPSELALDCACLYL